VKAPENEEAFKWMQASADQGYAQACYSLGNFYRSGTWVEADADKAFEYYKKAAEMGNSDGMERLGECFALGTGVAVNMNFSFQAFQRAAEMGNPKGQCHLGLSYIEGRGCLQDIGLGFQWIMQAAASGQPIVFQMLQNAGLDVPKLNDGYKRSQRSLAEATGDHFGGVFDKPCNESSKAIVPVAPGERCEM